MDLISVKNELFNNHRLYIQDLIKSLKVKRELPFSAYKIDLSLAYLKELYENIFPQKKHGGHLTSKNGEIKLNMSRDETYNERVSLSLRRDVPLLDRSIIINLFEGVKIRNRIPSFVELISTRVSLSKTTIQNRIRVGKFAINSDKIDDLILLYRKKEVSHSKVLKEIRKIEKRTIC
jgi:hypothetical protein